MNFNNSSFFIPILIIIGIVVWQLNKQESLFFRWVEDHWFFKKSKKRKIAHILSLFGIGLLLLSLLDLRGQEQKIKGKVSSQRTLILIDTSTSMLAEDVRPNRFEKAIFLARHFVKRAVGHHISVVTFSDIQKRLVPFTEDIDLLDSRINGLKNLDIKKGGTNLSFAIQESVQYFAENNPDDPAGNILIFTDAEDTEEGIGIKVSEDISVAVVGVGTRKGGVIPMRNKSGNFVGNKKFKGEVVISKLDEKFIQSLGEGVKYYKSWLASSYVIPTKDVLKFFQKSQKIKTSKDDVRIKPVLSHYLILPGVTFLLLSYLFKFSHAFICFLLVFQFNFSFANEENDEEKSPPPMSDSLKDSLGRYSRGELNKDEKLSVAEDFLKEKRPDQANAVYSDNLGEVDGSHLGDQFNYATSQIQSGSILKGLNRYKKIEDIIGDDEKYKELKKKIKKNRLVAIKKKDKGKKGKSKKKNKKDNNKKDSKDKKKGSQEQEGQEDKKDKKGDGQEEKKDQENKQNKDSQDSKDQKDKKSGDDQSKDEKSKDGKSKDQKDNKENDSKDEEKEDESDQKNPQSGNDNKDKSDSKKQKKKMPVILKQLVDQDKNLQEKLLDSSTENKRKRRDKKDW